MPPFYTDHARSHLAAIDAQWARLIAGVGDVRPPSYPQREPYEALIRSVASQQLSTRAASAIIAKLERHFSPDDQVFPTARQLVECEPEILRQCGFSARKIDTVRRITQGALDGVVPSRAQAETMTDEELIERLCALKGIGRWTVEMLLIGTLGRPNIMPVDDLGIKQGFRYLYGLTETPTLSALRSLSLPCHPYGSLAAWYLWRIPLMPDYPAFKASLRR